MFQADYKRVKYTLRKDADPELGVNAKPISDIPDSLDLAVG